jgi:tetratricopeptide (TPR) repeat protein
MLYRDTKGRREGVQGARESIMVCDSAIALCPDFAEPYYIKAIPYLKRGEFWKWKPIIDKAVECDTVEYIGYRGGARFMFLRDYGGAIADIEWLKSRNVPVGTIYNGDYSLECILALSYRGMGDTLKAIEILQKHVLSERRGYYDYYHLGVMLFQVNRPHEAEEVLRRQISLYPFADAYYYIALAYRNMFDYRAFADNMKRAHECYENGICLPGSGSYMDYPDKIYLKQIHNL